MRIEVEQGNIIHIQQRLTFVSIIYMMICAGIVFVIININKGNYLVASVETSVMALGIVLLIVLKKVDSLEVFFKLALSFLILFYSVMLFIISQPNTSENVYVWMFLCPYLSYLLLGRKAGLFVTLTVGTLAIYLTYQTKLDSKSAIPLINLFACMAMIWFLAHTYELSNEKSRKKLMLLSLHDNLTKLYNRKALPLIFSKHSQAQFLSLVVIDIDHFKKVNDHYGHDGGDAALIFLADEMTHFFDSMAYVVRMGGEEFCIIAPEMDCREVTIQMEQFLEILSNKQVKHHHNVFKITFSAGVASSPNDGKDMDELIRIADERLYSAKRAGRNCVCC